ncbi:protein artemis [Pieris rapae]|uniref:protein artemis n=1 Tax=Pieris rapae TaxID=64459 RepID=UPI001E27F8FD|nr:protein artemis [Pieris rapae]
MFQRCLRSSFQGKIEEIPGLHVDNFEYVESTIARAYFLSHCHSDHMQGLHSPSLLKYINEKNIFIYTTELSAAIIKENTEDDKILDYIKVLKLGSTLITLEGIPEENIEETYVTVTLIPAGHCVGAVMFLFQTINTTVLFTGDFRINEKDIYKYAGLHDVAEKPIKINTMYLDTTFIDLVYENFPKRSQSIDAMIKEIERCLSTGSGVALHTSAKYGYEYVFNKIYEKLGRKVYVNEDLWRFYRKISHLVPGVTNNNNEAIIHLCTKRNEKNHSTCIPRNYPQFVYIHLSAMKWINSNTFKPIQRMSPTRVDVCFATHCSRSEILGFVNYFKPDRVIGFPNPYIGERGVKRHSLREEGKLESILVKKFCS